MESLVLLGFLRMLSAEEVVSSGMSQAGHFIIYLFLEKRRSKFLVNFTPEEVCRMAHLKCVNIISDIKTMISSILGIVEYTWFLSLSFPFLNMANIYFCEKLRNEKNFFKY